MDANFKVSDNAKKEIQFKMKNKDARKTWFRVRIESGGCSGFNALFSFCEALEDGDLEFDFDGIKIVIDDVTYPILEGSIIEHTKNLMGSYFWLNVPNAKDRCGCGSSFSL